MYVIRLTRMTILSVCVGICALLGLVWLCFGRGGEAAVPASAGTGWGLSFQQEGQAPVGNAGKEELQAYDAWFLGNQEEKKLYLTFDVGYENGYTGRILDVLKEEQVPAAFFVVGHFVETEPKLVQRMAQEGHIIGNHTNSHPDMSAIRQEDAFLAELQTLAEKVEAVTGQPMAPYYRPPQGIYSEQNLEYAQRAGYHTIFWSLAYVDWNQDDQPDPQEAIELLNRRVHPGAVILLHSTSETNCEILQELIRGWKAQGYTFATLDDLCAGE